MPTGVLGSTLSGIAFGLLLNIFYSALKHAWPDNYFGLAGSVDPVVSRNAVRCLIFRFAPPFVAVVSSSLTAERFGGTAWLAGAATTVVHAGRLIPAAINAGRATRRRLPVSTIVLGVVLIGVAALAIVVRNTFDGLIPRPGELVANIWAGLLAAVGAVYLQGVVLVKRHPASLAKQSLEEIPVELGRLAVQRSRDRGLDERVPLAVMIAENMQRPPWFRRLEYKLPRFLNPTTGLMQQKSTTSDRESVERGLNLVLDLMSTPPPVDQYGYSDYYGWRRQIFQSLNYGEQFLSIVEGTFDLLDDDPLLIERFRPLPRP